MANIMTINGDGLSLKSFQEIREQLKEAWRSTFQEQGEIDLSPSSPDGMHVDLEAKAINDVAQCLQAIAANLQLKSAEGQWLENLASLFGLHRNEGETDAELRQRISSAHLGGFATYDGMLTYLRDKIDNNVDMQVNDEPIEMNGLPSHSFAVYVPDGLEMLPTEIAQHIWTCKPAGIRSFGNLSAIVADSKGEPHEIFYNMNTRTSIIVDITITEYSEEVLPADYEEAIKASLVEWANKQYTPGKDLIIQRMYSPIFNVKGILNIEIAVTLDGVTKTSGSFAIDSGHYIKIDPEDISVTLDEGL